MQTVLFLVLGTLFGFVLSRSGAADYNFIQGMFLFTNLQLYGIIGSAVAITAPGLWLLKRYGHTLFGRPLAIELKPGHRGNVGTFPCARISDIACRTSSPTRS